MKRKFVELCVINVVYNKGHKQATSICISGTFAECSPFDYP